MRRLSVCVFSLLFACSDPSPDSKDKKVNDVVHFEEEVKNPAQKVGSEFDIPELNVLASPDVAIKMDLPEFHSLVAYDVSPAGDNITYITSDKEGKCKVKVWSMSKNQSQDIFDVPDNFKPAELIHHPNATSFFILGQTGSGYEIYQLTLKDKKFNSIYQSKEKISDLLFCPRPFITGYDSKERAGFYSYRLFFAHEYAPKNFRIVSVTETGKRFYQVVGPDKSRTHSEEEESPSMLVAEWAVPVAFHPAGHGMIWKDQKNKLKISYYRTWWEGESQPLSVKFSGNTKLSPLPNGLGFLEWNEGKAGINILISQNKNAQSQLQDYKFFKTPVIAPDGKGVIATVKDGTVVSLNYLPVKIPLHDVVNAWMFVTKPHEMELFSKYDGLFRPEEGDQLYKLYETENYYCGSYDRSTPTRPYMVTTDVFWEIYSAAYQGIFLLKEKDQAIPSFYRFTDEAYKYYNKHNPGHTWTKVFKTINDLKAGNQANGEVRKILQWKDDESDILGEKYKFSQLQPRGHYNSSEEMKNYFMAFKYFTTCLKDDTVKLYELNKLPKDVQKYAVDWIDSYSKMISPSRSNLLWSESRNNIPAYVNYSNRNPVIFPLSWGFDNEVIYSTVYHDAFPPEKQITGPYGPRLLPSGLDLAASLGNGFASTLLEDDYKRYPNLRRVIENLRVNFKSNASGKSDNIYNTWINALAVQWIDTVLPGGKYQNNLLWNTKRLQTGLASWATLRHATILVNETGVAECGEGGYEEILLRAPRGYVEPDPYTFDAIAVLFETTVKMLSEDLDNAGNKSSLYNGILERLKEAAEKARYFKRIAEKEKRGEALTGKEYEDILYIARVAEHLFLVFNSANTREHGIADPDPIAKIADVASDGGSTNLFVAVGNSMEWDYIVPFFGRKQIVKGPVYSYYEFPFKGNLTDEEWRKNVSSQEFLPWLKPFITREQNSYPAKVAY